MDTTLHVSSDVYFEKLSGECRCSFSKEKLFLDGGMALRVKGTYNGRLYPVYVMVN